MKKNFLKNNFGGIAALGVLCLTLTMSFFSVLTEYGLMLKKKGELQDSLDVTSSWVVSHYLNLLSEGKTINPQEIRKLALQHFQMNMRLNPKDPVEFKLQLPSLEKKSLKITAGMVYTPVFLNVLGGFLPPGLKEKYMLVVNAESSTRALNSFEIALVVDVSGGPIETAVGMPGDDNIYAYRGELQNLLQHMRSDLGRVKVAAVPFATFVNPGVSWHGNDKWLDRYAKSPKHWSHFDFPPSNKKGVVDVFVNDSDHVLMEKVVKPPKTNDKGYVQYQRKKALGASSIEYVLSRYTLMTSMRYVDKSFDKKEHTIAWQGCVEAPLYPYNVTDSLNPDVGESLFVPTFYPDHPFENSKYSLVDYWPDTHGRNPIYPWEHEYKFRSVYGHRGVHFRCPLEPAQRYHCAKVKSKESSYLWTKEDKEKSIQYHGVDEESRDYKTLTKYNLFFNDIRKYFIVNKREDNNPHILKNINFKHNNSILQTKGPNTYCHNFPILPLADISSGSDVTDYTYIKNYLDKILYTQTHANLTEGLAWGWRVLSKDEPFQEGLPYNTPGNMKFIILFTQGKNHFYMIPGGAYYNKHNNLIPIFLETEEYGDVFERFYAKAYKSFAYKSKDFWEYSSYNAYGYGYYAMQQLKDSFQQRKFSPMAENLKKSPNDFIPSKNFGYWEEMNNQTQEVCRNIKDKNIKIITVIVGQKQRNTDRNKMSREIVKSCASPWPTFKIQDLEPPDHNKLYWDADEYGLEKTIADISSILKNYSNN